MVQKAKIIMDGFTKKVCLSKPDRKILLSLAKNSRDSLSNIARKHHLSREVVDYRIKRLKQEKVIVDLYTSINLRPLGFDSYEVFFSFNKLSEAAHKQVIDYFINHPYVSWVLELSGEWDLLVQVYASGRCAFDKVLESMQIANSDAINSCDVSLAISWHHTSQKYLFTRDELESTEKFSRESFSHIFEKSRIPAYVDGVDLKILSALEIDSRASLSKVARATNTTRDIVRYRINKLIRSDIISGFQLRVNHYRLGFQFMTLLIKVSVLPVSSEALINFLCLSPNVNVVIKLLGAWDYSVEFCYDSIFQLRKFIFDVKNFLGPQLVTFRALHQFSQFHYTPLPRGVVEELSKVKT